MSLLLLLSSVSDTREMVGGERSGGVGVFGDLREG